MAGATLPRAHPIAVDVGKHQLHVAFRSAGRGAWHCWSVPAGDRCGLVKLFSDFRALGADVVAVERPYLGNNPRVFAELTQACAVVEFAAEDAGLPHASILAAEWQPAMLYQPGERNLKRDALKQRSILRAGAEGVRTECHDTADSVNLCIFAATSDACTRIAKGIPA